MSELTGGQLIDIRRAQNKCIRCGVSDAPYNPYICVNCDKAILADKRALKARIAAAAKPGGAAKP